MVLQTDGGGDEQSDEGGKRALRGSMDGTC